MMPRSPAAPAILPLLCWSELAEIHRLQGEREQLQKRIGWFAHNCQRRMALSARLRELTLQQIALENAIGGRP